MTHETLRHAHTVFAAKPGRVGTRLRGRTDAGLVARAIPPFSGRRPSRCVSCTRLARAESSGEPQPGVLGHIRNGRAGHATDLNARLLQRGHRARSHQHSARGQKSSGEISCSACIAKTSISLRWKQILGKVVDVAAFCAREGRENRPWGRNPVRWLPCGSR